MNPFRPGLGCLLNPLLIPAICFGGIATYAFVELYRSDAACNRPASDRFQPFDNDRGAQALIGRARADIEADLGTGSRSAGYPWDAGYFVGAESCVSEQLLVLKYDDTGHVATADVITYVP